MTGLPTSGKMSVRMRLRDMMKPTRIAMRATITARGRLRAAKTRRIVFLSGDSLAGGLQEWLYIPASPIYLEKGAPHVQARDGIVNLGLDNETLCLRYIVDGC